MPWVVFTPAEWTAWHDAKCAASGIPKPGRRQSDQAVVVDNEWTLAYAQPTYTAVISNKTYYAVLLPDTENVTGLRVLTSLTVDPDTGAITIVYQGKTYTATPSGVTSYKTKPQSIVIDGVTYTRAG